MAQARDLAVPALVARLAPAAEEELAGEVELAEARLGQVDQELGN